MIRVSHVPALGDPMLCENIAFLHISCFSLEAAMLKSDDGYRGAASGKHHRARKWQTVITFSPWTFEGDPESDDSYRGGGRGI